ncbi:hypothetical protein CRYUN_Cryun01aG0220700 [Craigia yunnanensis]
MMPVYKYVDSNPRQRNQAPVPQHYFPGFKAVPPHLKVDPSKPLMMYESWPCNSNYGYAAPYHGCCNHSNFPGYNSFRSPCPHFAPSPAFHHYQNYPTYPEAYPVYYASPHYSNEQPRYEYDKDAHTNYHCCGCPNHPYNQKNDGSLKIEEQEPDVEKKEGDSVPIQPRSYPYPIVWIPPEYMKNKEYGKPNDQLEVSDWDKAPCFLKPSKNLKPTKQEPNSYPIVWIPPEYMKSKEYGKTNDQPEVNGWDKAPRFVKPTEQQPRIWNGWYPLDMNGLKSLIQGEGEKKSQNQQNEDKMTQFPFPIFWVPSDGKQEEDENQDKRRMITASDHSKQSPVSSEFIPVEPAVHDVRMYKPQSNKEIFDENASEAMGKTANKKCVPIQHMELQREDKPEGTEKRGRDRSVKRIEDTAKNELGGTTAKRKSPSPSKTSKLPPVCLRVDPLPKKSNGDGSSRSPSPSKGQPEDTLTKASTAPGLKEDFAINMQNSLDKVEPRGKEIKNIQVMEKRSMENKAGECTSASQAQVLGNLPLDFQEVSGKPAIEGIENDSHQSKTEEEKDVSSEEVMGAEKTADTMKANNPDESAHGQFRAEIKRMSDAEAAKIIQSLYRGFEVRKWEPLKKLKQIAKAREQVDEVRNHIETLESSSVLNKDDRQRLLIGEMIMSLLLKLDTIQGLHSSVRDARKSLVRELVTLQEKLDSLTSKWAEEKAKEMAAAESADFPRVDACRNVSIEKESKKASAVCINSFEDTNEKGNNIKELDQEYITRMVDEESNVEDEEPLNVDQALDGKIENETSEVTCDIQCHTAPRIQDGDMSPYLEHLTDLSSVPEQKSNADEFVEANDLTREGKSVVVEVNDSKEDKLGSLPKKMTDHVDAVCEMEKEIGNSYGENLRCTEKNKETDLLEELPVGIIDEEPAISEFETGKSNTLSSTEGCRAGCQADEQLLEATSGICLEAQKENEFNKNPEREVEVEQTQEKEVNNDKKFESLLKPEEVPSTIGEKNNDKVHEEEDYYGAIPADHMGSSESEAGSVATQEKEVLFEEKKEVQQPVEIEEKEEIKLENETEVQEQMPHETLEESVVVETDALSEPNVEQELLPASPAASQMSNDEHDLDKVGGDNKIIEENKNLREMMEKLMEAGKNQLTVISNLTGRVKELEEKLSRNRKSSKPRYRKARYAPSYSKPVRA